MVVKLSLSITFSNVNSVIEKCLWCMAKLRDERESKKFENSERDKR